MRVDGSTKQHTPAEMGPIGMSQSPPGMVFYTDLSAAILTGRVGMGGFPKDF